MKYSIFLLAIYNLEVAADNTMKMSIQFDKQDLEKIIRANYELPVSTSSVSRYVQENSYWEINDKKQTLTICSS